MPCHAFHSTCFLRLRQAGWMALWVGVAGCASEPVPLPTQVELAERDRTTDPPLFQLLYDAPVLPEHGPAAARLRQLVWLRHMALSKGQLDRLEALHGVVMERLTLMKQREQDVVDRWQAHEEVVYEKMWSQMLEGAPVDAPELNTLVDELRELRAGGARERELVSVRLSSVQSILDAEQEFLRTLSPQQEHLMADSLFFLRHRLDPIGNPGDFRALVGTTYEPGQYAVLQRGLEDGARQPLDIGGLWQGKDDMAGHVFFDAKREVLLMMALLEPEFPAAIEAAQALAEAENQASAVGPQPQAGAPEGAPPPQSGTPDGGASPAPGSPMPEPQ